MRNKLLLSSILCGAVAAGYAFLVQAPTAGAGGPKNLQVYPKNTDKKVIKKDMKSISKALGVQCDFCHDMSGMDKDTEHKNQARNMMRMTAKANAQLKKDGFKAQVTCMTCHQGNKEPKN